MADTVAAWIRQQGGGADHFMDRPCPGGFSKPGGKARLEVIQGTMYRSRPRFSSHFLIHIYKWLAEFEARFLCAAHPVVHKNLAAVAQDNDNGVSPPTI